MLFRREALAGRQQAWLGSIQLVQPLSLRLTGWFALCAVAAVLVFLCLGEYTRKARVAGFLVPDRGVLRVASPQAATVIERRVAEGQQVRAGDVLFVLALDSASQSVEGIAQNLVLQEQSLQGTADQQHQLMQAQGRALGERRLGLQREQLAAKAEIDLQAERLVLAKQALQRFENLARDQFISAAQLQTKREELLGLQANAKALQRQLESLSREQLDVDAQLAELPLKNEVKQGELARDLAELRRKGLETEGRRRLVLRAPSDGVIASLQADPGQSVASNALLANVLPADTRMQAQLYAPSSAVGFLKAQQAVLLRYQAFPFEKFGQQRGLVLQVARTPLAAGEIAALNLPLSTSTGEPLYRITVALDAQSVQAYGEPQALAAGMQLDADVLLERRRLIEWIFEPLLGLARRV
ncbi:MAG: HlyD family efflux transporter periplasmic adaptor subunit [Paucibacter sp.]|nr:HlyD family efflux transporter periplasmic adaptor subunit [Roseateles sp.]